MMNAMAAFGMAVGGTSLICYVLMTRLQDGKRTRRSSGDRSANDSTNVGGGDSSALDSSGNLTDGGGGDSGGGGDGGGGD